MQNKLKKILYIMRDMIKYYYYFCYCKIRKIKNDDIWLISERGTDARDNSYHFYQYMKIHHPHTKIKYVIDYQSADYHKLNQSDCIQYGSREHYILFITAGKLISTHIMGYSPNMSLFWRMDYRNLLKIKGKKIFLQHGITQNYIKLMTKEISKLDLFICGAYPEYEFILKHFGYDEKVIKYTGFARYDNLKSKEKNQILIMPTFRKWLNYTDHFKETEYFKKWNELLNDSTLIEYIEKNNVQVIFYPHYEIQKYLSYFHTKSKNITLASFNQYDVQALLIESKLLITDYSSVFFDFAYMRKPVIYYQFDIEEFRQNHYQEGYFDFLKMGFGPVCQEKEELVKKIQSKNMDYTKKISQFFQYHDFDNCERIYQEITKL